MTLARTFKRASMEDPHYSINDPAFVELLSGGGVSAGVTVSEKSVYGLPAYFRGVTLLSSMYAALPLKVYRNNTRERVTQKTVLDNPNPNQTTFEFFQTLYANAITWGTGFAFKRRNGADVVTRIDNLHPSKVRVEAVDESMQYPDGKLFLVNDRKGQEHRWSNWEIFQLPYMALDGLVGIRPLELFRQTYGIGLAADRVANRFFSNGARISGALTSDKLLDPDSVNKIRRRWREKYSGPDNAGEVIILDNGLAFTPLSLPPQDAELLVTRKWTVSEIARILGLPPVALSDVETSTSWGTGIEQQQIGVVVYTARPFLTASEQRITKEVLPGGWSAGSWFAEYAIEGLLRGDSAARAQFYATLIQWGIMTRNEAREKENFEPLDGLDEPLTPSNMTLISIDGQPQPLGGVGAKPNA